MLKEDCDIALATTDQRLINFNTELLKTKTTNNTQGVQALTTRKGRAVAAVGKIEDFLGADAYVDKFRAFKLPSSGASLQEQDMKTLFDLDA